MKKVLYTIGTIIRYDFWNEYQKKCPQCVSEDVVKNGFARGKQSYRCRKCGRQFIRKSNKVVLRQQLWEEYVWHKQTLKQLAGKHDHSIQWVQRQLDQASLKQIAEGGQKIVAACDTTFFGRGYGVLVVRCPRLKKNVHFHEVRSETPEEYRKARADLEARGYTIEAAVIDGKRGVAQVFSDIPTQFCQFHQIAIIRRYLTGKPKLEAAKELRAITLSLTTSTEITFIKLLTLWHERWQDFLKERTVSEDGKRWQYTHRRIRSAYRSLQTNLPYLFTCQKYPALNIPNTTNSIDGFFSKLKQLLNAHRGLTTERRYRLIQEILA